MKPATSALNDWLKTIIVHKSFNNLRIHKSDPHFATIELATEQQYSNASNHYEFTSIASIYLAVVEINGKLTNVVKFCMTMPSGFVDYSLSDGYRCEQFTNITLKNLIDFVEFFRKMYRQDSLSQMYNIPNYHNMGFTHDYKPFKGSFEQYFFQHKKEYDKFLEYREILFSYLDKNSKINAKKKDIKMDFVKG
ncbi:MAG: hypothetical protein J6T10_11780 [Methanobrevibacter sp.]|nr:hypothetical protein [Methanobrevibacter sp.]